MRIIHPRIAIILHDLSMVWAAWILVHMLRYTIWPDSPDISLWPVEMPVILLSQGLILYFMGLYRGIWRFASLPDLWNIIRASLYGTLMITLLLFWFNRLEGIPRSVLFLYPIFLVLLLGGPRLLYRVWKDHKLVFFARPGGERVLIIGAGSAGELLTRDLKGEGRYYPAGFLDDDRQLWGAKLRGLPVFGGIKKLPEVVIDQEIDLVVIAIPSATNQQMQRIVEICENADIAFRTLPRLQDMEETQGHFHFKSVAIEDLLGRAPVELDWDLIGQGLNGKSVLVTGGGGSIGAELCRQIARLTPERLCIVELSEYNLYRIEYELRAQYPKLRLELCLGDVGDVTLIERCFQKFSPEIVFHAAAYKHVPLLQGQLREAFKNNVLGTKRLAMVADRYEAERFILISTDKAVNPANILGASKRAAEVFCQTFAGTSKTQFMTVRFGNVLDSAGSVVPLFREQIKKGGPVTVTHPDVTRYFMTIPESCQLIIQTSAIGKTGEIYILDMGQPVKIQYLAEQMIRLSNHAPNKDIQIVYTGLRAGEKLYEELFYDSENYAPTEHQQIFKADCHPLNWSVLNQRLKKAEQAVSEFDENSLEQILNEIVPEFESQIVNIKSAV